MAKIFVCGDIINQFCHTQFIDPNFCKIISHCDYAIGNLEGVEAKEDCNILEMQQVPGTIKNLKNAGFNLMLLANNHIADYGEDGLKRTIRLLKDNNIDYIGAGTTFSEAYAYKIVEIGRKKFAFLNICEAQAGYFQYKSQKYGYAWLGHNMVESLIREARKQADYLIVFVHAGLEHYQLPLRQFRLLYQHYCDLGASCVIASHPHIVQGIETFNNSIIAYSLGNFYFPRTPEADKFSDQENEAFSIVLNFENDVISYDIIYHGITNGIVSIVEPSPKTNVVELSQKLTEPFYTNALNKQNIDAFTKVSRNLYWTAFNSADAQISFLSKLKFLIRYIFFKETAQKKYHRISLFRHLNSNETYRFLNEDALCHKLKLKDK